MVTLTLRFDLTYVSAGFWLIMIATASLTTIILMWINGTGRVGSLALHG